MQRFQTKDDHLAAFARAVTELMDIRRDYEIEEIGHGKWMREFKRIREELLELCDLTLSDPPPEASYAEPDTL